AAPRRPAVEPEGLARRPGLAVGQPRHPAAAGARLPGLLPGRLPPLAARQPAADPRAPPRVRPARGQLISPRLLARATAWVRRSTPSLLLMWRAWVLTVCREMNS